MQLVSSEAIILRTQDYGERDRLLTFLARSEGKVRAIVKGSRKLTSRGVGNFEALGHGVMHYSEPSASGLVTIRKCDPLPPYLTLQQDYDAYLFAGYLSELIDLCTVPAGDADGFYRLLLGALEALCTPGTPRRLPLIRLRFELRLLELLGLQPQWDECAACGTPLPLAPALPPALAETPVRPGAAAEAGGGPAAEDRVGSDPLLNLETQDPEPPHFEPPHFETLCFDTQRGGLLCPDCAPGRRALVLSSRTRAFLSAWRAGHDTPVARPTRRALEELDAAVSAHLTHHMERLPRSRALLPSMADLERRGEGASAPREGG